MLSWAAAAARCAGEYGAAGVGLFGIIIMWAGLFYSLLVDRQAAIDKAFGDTNNYARAFRLQSAGIVRSIDQTLLYMRASYTRAPDQFDITRWSEHGAFLTNPACQVSIIDTDGRLRAELQRAAIETRHLPHHRPGGCGAQGNSLIAISLQ